jgi:hypothetical protein
MPCYLITYDLVGTNETSKDYENLIAAIKELGRWGKVEKSVWAVVTSHSAVQIRDKLTPHLDANDRLFVVKSGVEAAWQNSICKNEWLRENL